MNVFLTEYGIMQNMLALTKCQFIFSHTIKYESVHCFAPTNTLLFNTLYFAV